MASPFAHTTRALAGDSALAAVAAWAVALLLLLAWAAWFLFGRVTVMEVSSRARLEVRQAAHAVTPEVPGRLVATSLVLGAEVQAGEVLAELDSGGRQLELAETSERRAALATQLQALQAELQARQQAAAEQQHADQAAHQAATARGNEAAAALAFATEQARRLREESAAGSVAAVEALQAQAEVNKLAAAREALAAELRRLQSEAQARGAEQRAHLETLHRNAAALEGEQAMLGATLARLQLEVDRHRVRAPVAGRIAELAPLRPGDVLAAGQKLATLLPAGELLIAAEFEPAAVLGRVKPGQRAQLRLDGFPWAQFGTVPARVARVAGELREQRVRVEFTPQGTLPAGVPLQHGLPGTMEVVVERVAPAALVLRAAGQLLATPAQAAPAPR